MSGNVIPLFKGGGDESPPTKDPFLYFPAGSRLDPTEKQGLVFSLDPNASPAAQAEWESWLQEIIPVLEVRKVCFEVFSVNNTGWNRRKDEIPVSVRIFFKEGKRLR